MLDKAVPPLTPMLDRPPLDARPHAAGHDRPCRLVGRFVGKDACFALRQRCGAEIWLEMDRIPLHLLDEEVEITGRRFGPSLVWVEAIGPARSLS